MHQDQNIWRILVRIFGKYFQIFSGNISRQNCSTQQIENAVGGHLFLEVLLAVLL